MNVKSTRVFFDIEIDGVRAGRIVMDLCADMSPKAVENFWALCDGENGRPRSYYDDYSSSIRDKPFFEAGPNSYMGLSKTWGVVSGKVLDGLDVLKGLESVQVIHRYGRYSRMLEPVIRVTCGQLSDQYMKNHNIKNYGPTYHNLIKGSRIPHQYVYRSGQGKDHHLYYSYFLELSCRCCRWSSRSPPVLSLLNQMSIAFLAFIFG